VPAPGSATNATRIYGEPIGMGGGRQPCGIEGHDRAAIAVRRREIEPIVNAGDVQLPQPTAMSEHFIRDVHQEAILRQIERDPPAKSIDDAQRVLGRRGFRKTRRHQSIFEAAERPLNLCQFPLPPRWHRAGRETGIAGQPEPRTRQK
jgi:hypothetical protein